MNLQRRYRSRVTAATRRQEMVDAFDALTTLPHSGPQLHQKGFANVLLVAADARKAIDEYVAAYRTLKDDSR